MTNTPLILALPSKGSLHAPMVALLERCFLSPTRSNGGRAYTGHLSGIDDASVLYARADDIGELVGSGQAHVGITGLDLFQETADAEHSTSVEMVIEDLGFGQASLEVGIPVTWIDVGDFGDLTEVARDIRINHGRPLRVATKFPNLTRQHFITHGLSDFRLVASAGATEAAPRSGTADIVVDLVSSGTTYDANGLTTIKHGLVLNSQACLIASSEPNAWNPTALDAFEHFGGLLSASIRARNMRALRASFPSSWTPQPPDTGSDLDELIKNLSDVRVYRTESGVHELAATFHTRDVHQVLASARRAGALAAKVLECDVMADYSSSAIDGFLSTISRSSPQ